MKQKSMKYEIFHSELTHCLPELLTMLDISTDSKLFIAGDQGFAKVICLCVNDRQQERYTLLR